MTYDKKSAKMLRTKIIINILAIFIMSIFSLNTSSPGKSCIVDHIEDLQTPDPISNRLRDLGFVSGETVKVIAFGPFGANPIAVQVGSTRFALRRNEAARVIIRADS
ncbi:Fe2+ transport protein FeoA (FeoA) (PDB:2GCX) [Commensalibacter communis]|uniref:Fe2+ transport protein FeoA (FeoA) n=2 Tax=Commensalibacter communis TaxID=2972786 RepID=A0A9W4TQP3_9PROT|nr:Fe2+ transport protein FeoA (FeoA) (PDB:2GCX) [Commensalibacter communis]CAI3960450.1 Fe2+ transport protein FeoA (FeoA) (PDB:2GCX) [Commensalibacter communis]CAI3960718.1 Fe2+ transport protein FeoA (FeoA) (PDB:2GCX) [Commensalibacter communis]CAI3960847.1 Fe2+ transport protein FeoA (FeoA) (PDB:2GCX) [Commensalibacter communis]